MRRICPMLRMGARNKERVRPRDPFLLCRAEPRATPNQSPQTVLRRIGFRQTQLNVLRAVAIDLPSANAQTSIRQDFSFAIDAHAPPRRQVDNHRADVGMAPEITGQRITIQIGGPRGQRVGVKYADESWIRYA